jgi:hypothetical protein
VAPFQVGARPQIWQNPFCSIMIHSRIAPVSVW